MVQTGGHKTGIGKGSAVQHGIEVLPGWKAAATLQEAQQLKACGGGLEINGAADFQRIMDRFDANPQQVEADGKKAGDYVKGKAGATDKVLHSVGL